MCVCECVLSVINVLHESDTPLTADASVVQLEREANHTHTHTHTLKKKTDQINKLK